MSSIGVIGAGTWGTVLASVLARNGNTVHMWVKDRRLFELIANKRENDRYLPGYSIPERVSPTLQLHEACRDKDFVLSVVPTQFVRSIFEKARHHISRKSIIINTSKGIEVTSLKLASEVLREVLPDSLKRRLAVLSGPSYAREVADGEVTAVTVASDDPSVSMEVQKLFSASNLRIYIQDDVVGTEVGGAVKNIIAVAVGMADGAGMGENTKAAIISRGFSEMMRFGVALGAKPATFYGLSGLGDLILTCTGTLSRNRRLGELLGRGYDVEACMQMINGLPEGLETVRAVRALSRKLGISMPVVEQVYRVICEGLKPGEAVNNMLKVFPGEFE